MRHIAGGPTSKIQDVFGFARRQPKIKIPINGPAVVEIIELSESRMFVVQVGHVNAPSSTCL